jgi:hypothetical protein
MEVFQLGNKDKYLFAFIRKAMKCPNCGSRFTMINGTVDDKPTYIIQCEQKENKHNFTIHVELRPLEPRKEVVISGQ